MRLATFNILHGRSPEDGNVDLGRFAAAVRGLDADVLALQEVDRNQARSGGADLTALAADAMGGSEYRFVAAVCGPPGQWVAATGEERADSPSYGIALISRYRVRSWRVIRLAPSTFRAPKLFIGRRTREVFHDEPRVAVAAMVDAPSGPITIVNTHLTFLRWWNRRQLTKLRGSLEGSPRPLVLMGDLNMGQARAERLSGLTSLVTAPTFPAHEPREQLDHILASAELEAQVVRGRAHALQLSDHRALSVDLR